MPRFSRKKKKQLVGGVAVVLALAVTTVAVLESDMQLDGVGGTMGAAAAIELHDIDAGWDTGSERATLDQAFVAEFEAENPLGIERDEEILLVFSRDKSFDVTEDCVVESRAVQLAPESRTAFRFSSAAHLVDCLDAGPWFASVYLARAEQWHELPGTFPIDGSTAYASLRESDVEVAHEGTVALEIDLNRAGTPYGTLGVYDQPVDVWLKKDDQLCLIEAARTTLERDPVRLSAGQWSVDALTIEADTKEAVAVRVTNRFPDPFDGDVRDRECADCAQPERVGDCAITEGLWRVTVGPSTAGFMEEAAIYVHARPTKMSADKIELTLVAGEEIAVERSIENPSVRPVGWSFAPADRPEGLWISGSEGRLESRASDGTVSFLVSAANIEPGFYSGDVVFRAKDFYETTVSIAVELTVERRPLDVAMGGAETAPEFPEMVALGNYPNPFAGRTTIQVQMQESGNVRLAVFDLSGREVRILADGYLAAGSTEIPFDASDLPSGTYLYRLTTPHGSLSETMTVVR